MYTYKNAYLSPTDRYTKIAPKASSVSIPRGTSSSKREHDFSFFYFCSGFVFTLFHVRL